MQNLPPAEFFIGYTVRPTSDPDMVTVTPPCSVDVIRYRDDVADLILDDLGAVSLAARRWFDAHPPKPVHPLADAKVGEWWLVTWNGGDREARKIRAEDDPLKWHAVEARQVYVIPRAGADAEIAPYYGTRIVVDARKILGLAL